MKKIIRTGVFETNSSSTHSLSIVTKETFDRWVEEDMFYDENNDELITKEEAKKYINEDLINSNESSNTFEKYMEECDQTEEEVFAEFGFISYDNLGGDYYETFQREFTTPSGDCMVAFGYYGECR